MNLRNQKGINMITLSVAVLILVIITSILVYSSRDGVNVRNLKDLYNDIEFLNNKVGTYYAQNGDIPKSAKYENLSFLNLADYNELNPNNGDDFYVIDLKAMEGITLNYGRDYDRVSKNQIVTSGYDDIYIINEKSHTIYYPRGIDVQGVKHFTYIENWQKVDLSVIPIYTAEQLAKVGSGETLNIDGEDYTFSLDGNYLLKNDIDLSSICYKVDGTAANDKSWTPIGTEANPFAGVFYGNGHEIKNLYINTTANNQGLFARNFGTVQDVIVEGKITSTSSSIGSITSLNSGTIINCNSHTIVIGKNQIGGIASLNSGTITECKNYNKVEGIIENSNHGEVGGIVGINYTTGIILKAYNEGNIVAKSNQIGGITGNNQGKVELCVNNGTVSSYNYDVGGIAGYQPNENAKISNSYNLKEVKNNNTVGGILGQNYGIVLNCYNIANITGNNSKSIVGINKANVSNCYYLSTLSTTDSNATPKTAEEMKSQAFVNLLNNGQEDAPWIMDTKGINEGYPVLKWQYEELK